MGVDKAVLVNIVLMLHFILTGIMLFRMFKIKNAKGGDIILALLVLMLPLIGPLALILYFNKRYRTEQSQSTSAAKKTLTNPKKKNKRP